MLAPTQWTFGETGTLKRSGYVMTYITSGYIINKINYYSFGLMNCLSSTIYLVRVGAQKRENNVRGNFF